MDTLHRHPFGLIWGRRVFHTNGAHQFNPRFGNPYRVSGNWPHRIEPRHSRALFQLQLLLSVGRSAGVIKQDKRIIVACGMRADQAFER